MIGVKSFNKRLIFFISLVKLATSIKILNHGSVKSNNSDLPLRYVAFGTDVSAGYDENRNKTYLELLSPDGVNLAMKGSDPSYPAMCTQTMIGDDKIYDVIIIEYDVRFESGLRSLCKRLRRRFPEATIIVTQIWNFNMLYVKGKQKMFMKWLRAEGYEKNNLETRDFLSNQKIEDLEISFLWHYLEHRIEYTSQLEDDFNVKVYSWETDGDVEHMKHLLLQHLPLFSDDWVHLSDYGHQFIADGLQEIIKTVGTKPSNKVGTWGDGDFCGKWLNGVVDEKVKRLLQYERSFLQFKKFHLGKNYFALHFPYRGNLVRITNPFNEKRLLSLTYMATGPEEKIYPKTLVQIIKTGAPPVIIVPFESDYVYPVHIQLTKEIGLLNVGVNDVIIRPFEKTESPFRLVGFSITNGKEKTSELFNENII